MTDRDWCLRNEIIWHKPNCMPSSVKDRFTVDFEKLFFFTKSKRYYFEPQYEPQIDWGLRERSANKYRAAGLANGLSGELNPNGRNKRTVWTISTKPYSGAHFAVFPPELVETPIKAGCPGEICSKCGKAREKLVDTSEKIKEHAPRDYPIKIGDTQGVSQSSAFRTGLRTVYKDAGYSDCGCGAPFVPGVVLDPFGGSGTTAKVARSLGRSSIIIELNPAYLELATERAMTNVPDVLSFEARGAGP